MIVSYFLLVPNYKRVASFSMLPLVVVFFSLVVTMSRAPSLVVHAQYYQALNPNSFELNYNPSNYDDANNNNNNNNGNSNANTDNNANNGVDNYVEKKYVNSGQSIVLICDLPNNMPDGKVLFIKYDSKVLSSGINIRGDSDDERFEIGQQYAWEWSLKINSINEDDSGVYFCKVGNTIIKKFEIIVRVPPRIKDDPLNPASSQAPIVSKQIREGASVEFACFSSGTPRPNITWYALQPDGSAELLPHTGTYLKIDNVTRFTPRRYQCRASNGIPPSDTRNLTLAVEFAPEIEIQSKYEASKNTMNLNCTIVANPLTNRNFWRKDGNFLVDGFKYNVNNIRINEYTLISKLSIKYYEDADQGLYECTAENDLRVSKIVFNLREENLLNQKPIDLIQIGSSNEGQFPNESSSLNKQKNKKPITNQNRSKTNQSHRRNNKISQNDSNDSSNYNYEYKSISVNNQQRKHQRNHRNSTKSPSTNLLFTTASSLLQQPTTEEIKNYKSPYIILINEDNSNSGESSSDSSSLLRKESSDSYLNQQLQNNCSSMFFLLKRLNFNSCFLLIVLYKISRVFIHFI